MNHETIYYEKSFFEDKNLTAAMKMKDIVDNYGSMGRVERRVRKDEVNARLRLYEHNRVGLPANKVIVNR